ncbi:TrkH family potassium uptake protein [Halorientalis pallida]|uniref:TrkH family potassium uptake protein n=1 Tax=Halorientalis pallida TaxID=2479928 RepID=A0A498L386_9EURY|nr:TrkH family potassium uptake protein [Halorientalis pallida]RXK51781.1 TrkH family potassium uptake protein [Halorientalis pallida]
MSRVAVDWRTSATLVGTVLKALTVPLAGTAAVAAWYGEAVVPFLVPLIGSLVAGVALERFDRRDLGLRESYLMVALTWLTIALVGAVPFVLAGHGVLAEPVNAMFESMSGVTTTGATVIDSFDAHGRSIHLWRSVLQWMGGLGILVLAVAVLSQISVGGAQLMETETQTQDLTKLTPRIEETARLLGLLYVGLTALMVCSWLALRVAGVAPNVTLYQAVAHAFTAVSTAGFSPEPASLGAFSPAIQWVTIPFMFLGATNFILLYFLLRGDPSRLTGSDEFRFYAAIVLGLTALTGTFLVVDGQFSRVEPLVRHALFQVVSIVTTTGYATVDFDLWSAGAKHVLFLAMFVGGMAGSTTCSIKTLRWLVVVKSLRRDLFTEIHPEAIRPVRLSGQVVDEETIKDIYGYVLLSLVLFALLTVFVVVDATRTVTRVGEFDAMGAAAATFLNIGPAFGAAGPYGSYLHFPDTTKVAMIVLMWVGRIEIIPVLVLLTPAYWRS